MFIFNEGIRSSHVTLFPDGTEFWQRTFSRSLHADILVSPDCDKEVLEEAKQYAALRDRELPSTDLWGGHGLVFQSENPAFAIKIAKYRVGTRWSFNLDDMIANHALAMGLRRIPHVISMLTDVPVAAPRLYAMISPAGGLSTTTRPTYVMDYLQGKMPRNLDPLFNQVENSNVYPEAIAACGYDPEVVYLDAGKENVLLSYKPGVDTPTGLYRFDVQATQHIAPLLYEDAYV